MVIYFEKKRKKKELCFSCRAYSFLSSMYTICTVYYCPLISHGRRNQLSGVTPQNMASLHLLSHLNMPTTMFWEGTSSFSASNFWWWRSTRICRQQTPMQPSCSWELFRTQGESSWWWRTRRWLWTYDVILYVFSLCSESTKWHPGSSLTIAKEGRGNCKFFVINNKEGLWSIGAY